MNDTLNQKLEAVILQYKAAFLAKTYSLENEDHDILMDIYRIDPALKRENRQYWGRELGMCWQRIVTTVSKELALDFQPALKVGADEPVDLIIGKDAIDTKYRIGSGDSGTLKKFKTYGKWIREQGYNPVLLILREDNLPAAIQACVVGGWDIMIGDDCFSYLEAKTGFDLKNYLIKNKNKFAVNR